MHAELEDFLSYSHGDGAFAAWCQEVDTLSLHFLSMSFFEFEEEIDPEEAYHAGASPIQYVKLTLIHEVVCNYGFECVESLVANNVMWGQTY